MGINRALNGTKVRLTGKDDWDGGGLDQTLTILSVNDIYTIDHVDIGDYVDFVCLEEFPDQYFNYGLFEKI